MKNGVVQALRAPGPRNRVLGSPPDITRFHSGAGNLTSNAYEFYGNRLSAVLPAVGTHAAMTPGQIAKMFAGVPFELFHAHNRRNDLLTLAKLPPHFLPPQSQPTMN